MQIIFAMKCGKPNASCAQNHSNRVTQRGMGNIKWNRKGAHSAVYTASFLISVNSEPNVLSM